MPEVVIEPPVDNRELGDEVERAIVPHVWEQRIYQRTLLKLQIL